MTCKIERSKDGPYYTVTIDGKFEGNYDTPVEAAKELDILLEKIRKEEQSA